jgi:hypothetical protein
MVLLGVGKGFLRLITTQDNGIVVDGKPFYISTDTQKKMHELAKEMKPHGSFTKGFCSIAECASCALSGALEHVMPTVETSTHNRPCKIAGLCQCRAMLALLTKQIILLHREMMWGAIYPRGTEK